jgi:hypothetical protein
MIPTPRAKEPGSTSLGYGDSLNDFASRLVNGYAKKDIELLRSPTASQGQGGALGEEEARKRGNTVGIRDQAMDLAKLQGYKVSRQADNLELFGTVTTATSGRSPKFRGNGTSVVEFAEEVAEKLNKLPTPTVSDQYTGNLSSTQQKPGSMHSVTLAQVFNKPDLFPTPVASEGTKAPSQQTSETKSKTGQVWLSNVAKDVEQNNIDNKQTNWGKFEAAIRRWELVIGRPAPEPTKPDGKDGNHRLSSKFTEWMMGLPEGWITGHGLKRNDELKLAGNGVVPQQAELALRILLNLPKEKKNK